MSLFMHKHAIKSDSPSNLGRKSRKRSKGGDRAQTTRRVCRVEELEKREYLAADPISVGVVYAEQYQEDLGDKFYVAWVGGEDGCTTLDSLIINLDKNGNGALDEGEAFFDTLQGGERGVYEAADFAVVDKTDRIGYQYDVKDGGMVLEITFTNFYAGDHFIFTIDLDEYQTNSSIGSQNAQVEGGEMGGSVLNGIDGSIAKASFSSDHYQTETWTGMFVDEYDHEYPRSAALSEQFDPKYLPFDADDGNGGIDQAGIYDVFNLTPKPIVVSGTVYADHDVDCNYDLGQDEPLAGVEVALVNDEGKVWTTTTDVNGYYEFNSDDLMPGHYRICSESNIVSPEGWQYFDFCAKGGTYGEKIDPLTIDVDGMKGGEVAPNNNFAKALVSTIDGHVFEDLNDANGKEDGENWDGVAYPAEIQLWRIDYDADGKPNFTFMESQTVDANGYYKFILDGSWNAEGSLRKLPEKTYEIREIFDSPDYSDGKDYVGTLGGKTWNDVFTDVYVGYGKNGYNYDFGELKRGSIAGNVWEDRNDNGEINPGEAGIANVVVELYQWDGANYVKIDETTTDADGAYLFEDLDICCEYAVKERQPDGYSDGKDSLGSLGGKMENDRFSNIEIGWDQHGTDYNFGELKLGSIAGNVYEDRNDNGFFDEGERGIANATIELYQWDGTDYVKIAETQTAEDGSYLFANLDISKEYAVREKQPTGYDDGKDSVGSLGGVLDNDEIRAINVNWDEHGVDYNFGELKLGSIAGNVYEDRNNNGIFDEGERGIGATTVALYQLVDGQYVKIRETKTSDDGSYLFDKLDINQTYGVKEIQPTDYDDGKDSVGSLGGQVAANDYVNAIDVQWDNHGVDYNFGELKLGSISGYVYHDANDDGVKQEGEEGIADVVVELYQVVDGEYVKIKETTTDATGFYKFDSLDIEQTYAVREIQPTDWDDGKDAVGTLGGKLVESDHIDSIRVLWDEHGQEYDFGELMPPASLSGYVYEDDNNNGVQDPAEAGIENVLVQIYVVGADGTATLVDSQRTDSNGFYQFSNLDPDRTYVVREIQPTEYFDGKDAVGTIFGKKVGRLGDNDEIVDIVLPKRGRGVRYDFGELRPASLSGYVYEDDNDNGIKEEGEKGIPNVDVSLWILNESTNAYENTGRVVKTDSYGHYVFEGLEPARIYRLVETQPENYNDGKDTAGSLGGEVENDVIFSIPVAPGDKGVEYNFGELPIIIPPPPYRPDITPPTPSIYVPNNLWSPAPTNYPYVWRQPTVPGSMTTLYGGGGGMPEAYSWKLSVVNGASPRLAFDQDSSFASYGVRGNVLLENSAYELMTVSNTRSSQPIGQWLVRGSDMSKKLFVYDTFDQDGESAFKLGVKPIVGDWNGDGKDKLGLFSDGMWFVELGDNIYLRAYKLGSAVDQPVVGDWDGDGKIDLAIFGPQWIDDPTAVSIDPGLPADLNRAVVSTLRPKNMAPEDAIFKDAPEQYTRIINAAAKRTFPRGDAVDHVFEYGGKGDVALVGDWNGDGTSKIGYYRNGEWYLDVNGNGVFDNPDSLSGNADVLLSHIGGKGSVPIVGDWNGDGVDDIGVFTDGAWKLYTNEGGSFREYDSFTYGQKGDMPVAGDFDGDGVDEVAVYRSFTQNDLK